MPFMCDRRATQQVKIYVNKLFKNKNSGNKEIAKLITSYSHSTVLDIGSMFEKRGNPEYYVVSQVDSPFWVRAVHLPSTVQWIPDPHPLGFHTAIGHLSFIPDWNKAVGFSKKKIFSPFDRPYIKKRNKRFYFRAPFFMKV
jgi:hypothetical protein